MSGWFTEVTILLLLLWSQQRQLSLFNPPLHQKVSQESLPSNVGAVVEVEAVSIVEAVEIAVVPDVAARTHPTLINPTLTKIKTNLPIKDLTKRVLGPLQTFQTMPVLAIGRMAEMRPTVPTL